jgi:transcriptional regulator with PAS, ATPase and Fis domain
MIVGSGDWIRATDLPARLGSSKESQSNEVDDGLKTAMRAYERLHIGNVLNRTTGDKRAAAELLGISLSSLYRKIEELEISA